MTNSGQMLSDIFSYMNMDIWYKFHGQNNLVTSINHIIHLIQQSIILDTDIHCIIGWLHQEEKKQKTSLA